MAYFPFLENHVLLLTTTQPFRETAELVCTHTIPASFPGSLSFRAIIPRMTFDPPELVCAHTILCANDGRMRHSNEAVYPNMHCGTSCEVTFMLCHVLNLNRGTSCESSFMLCHFLNLNQACTFLSMFRCNL